MFVVDSVEKAVSLLSQGYGLVRCPIGHIQHRAEILVAGRLVGFNAFDWWYVFESPNAGSDKGIVDKRLFYQLYKNFYLRQKTVAEGDGAICYELNDYCDIQEFPRYQHLLNCLEQQNSRPIKAKL